jgi:hypothetical protein
MTTGPSSTRKKQTKASPRKKVMADDLAPGKATEEISPIKKAPKKASSTKKSNEGSSLTGKVTESVSSVKKVIEKASPTDNLARKSSKTTERPALGPFLSVVVGLVLALAAFAFGVYLLRITSSTGENQTVDLLFFIDVIVIGVSTTFFLFGALTSYARYRGRNSLGTLELGGPVVVAALVVTGFYYLYHNQSPISLQIKVDGVANVSGTDASEYFDGSYVTTSIDDFRERLFLNQNGEAYLWKLSPSLRGTKIKVRAQIPDHTQVDIEKEFVVEPGATFFTKVEFDDKADLSGAIPKAVDDISKQLSLSVPDRDRVMDSLGGILIRAMDLVDSRWTYWRDIPTDLVSELKFVPVDNSIHQCQGAEWLIRKGPGSVHLFVTGCRPNDTKLGWNLTINSEDKSARSPIGNPKASQNSPPDAVPTTQIPISLSVSPGIATVASSSISTASEESVFIKFENETHQTAQIVWVDFGGDQKIYNTLEPGSSYTQGTYKEHVWFVRTQGGVESPRFVARGDAKFFQVGIMSQ